MTPARPIALCLLTLSLGAAAGCERQSRVSAPLASHPQSGELYVVLSEMCELAEETLEEEEAPARIALEAFGHRALELSRQIVTDAAWRQQLETLTSRLSTAEMYWIDDEAARLRADFARTWPLPPPPQGLDPIEGAHLYGTACAPCHGQNGEPLPEVTARMIPPPTNLRMLARNADFDPRWVNLVIEHGVPTTPMPAFEHAFSDQDRWNIAGFIASMK